MDYFITIFLGAVASHLQQDKFKKLGPFWQFFISFSSCFAVSFVLTIIDFSQKGIFELDQFLAVVGMAFVGSQTYYNLYFKDKLNNG